jgi:hypothetical protein
MMAEFTLDLCFIRLNIITEKFTDLLEVELESLFAGKGKWTVKARQEGQLDIVLVEVIGVWNWQTEAMVAAYLEDKGSRQFREWLKGFRLSLN